MSGSRSSTSYSTEYDDTEEHTNVIPQHVPNYWAPEAEKEKRRREEDDDDGEKGHNTYNRRRNKRGEH